MPGFGFGEILVIAVVVLIAVGPQRLPQMMKTVGRSLREVRNAANELRRASGIDEIMRDDPFGTRSSVRPRNPLGPLGSTGGGGSAAGAVAAAAAKVAEAGPAAAEGPAKAVQPEALGAEAVRREYPAEAVDVAHARARPRPAAEREPAAAPPEAAAQDGEP